MGGADDASGNAGEIGSGGGTSGATAGGATNGTAEGFGSLVGRGVSFINAGSAESGRVDG